MTLGHPGIVDRMKQNPDKSDMADAWILADLMRLSYLPKVWLAPETIRQLRSPVCLRAAKVKEQIQVKLRQPVSSNTPLSYDAKSNARIEDWEPSSISRVPAPTCNPLDKQRA